MKLLSLYTILILHTCILTKETNTGGYCKPKQDGTGCEEEEMEHKHKYSYEENIAEDIKIDHEEANEELNDKEEKEEQKEEQKEKGKEPEVKEERKEFQENFARKLPVIPKSYLLDEEQQIFFPKGEGLARRNGVKVRICFDCYVRSFVFFFILLTGIANLLLSNFVAKLLCKWF